MKKLCLSFAALVFVFLFACSDEKEPSHRELCGKTPIPEKCLTKGVWYLTEVLSSGVTEAECKDKAGLLRFTYDKERGFEYDYDDALNGKVILEGNNLTIHCMNGDCDTEMQPSVASTITFEASGDILKVSSTGYTAFSQCKIPSKVLVEKFEWGEQ